LNWYSLLFSCDRADQLDGIATGLDSYFFWYGQLCLPLPNKLNNLLHHHGGVKLPGEASY
jgi:hypothetical protein